MSFKGDLYEPDTWAPVHEIVGGERARDKLVSLIGARQADNLLAQLHSAGFKIVPIERPIPGLRPE